MQLTIFFDHRYSLDDDGKLTSATHYNYSLFKNRYLPFFSSIKIMARTPLPVGDRQSLGDAVEIVSVGEWNGAFDFFSKRKKIHRLIKNEVQSGVALMIVPGLLGSLSSSILKRKKIPYAVEVVGDPWGSMGPGTSENRLRPMMRLYMTLQLKMVCRSASCAAYVTEFALQAAYPAPNAVYTTHYSSIELTPEHFANGPRQYTASPSPPVIICIGTMAHLYKGQDVLIDAMAYCKQLMPDISLLLVGDGMYKQRLERQVRSLSLDNNVKFLGRLPPGFPIIEQLDCSDVYVLPTRGEGLPRTIIEAMARGLPCIGTRVSGVPELIDEECLVAPGSSQELAERIIALLKSPDRLSNASARNIGQAKKYLSNRLVPRRSELYRSLAKLG